MDGEVLNSPTEEHRKEELGISTAVINTASALPAQSTEMLQSQDFATDVC